MTSMTTGLMLTRTTYILSAGVKKQAIPWRPPSVSSFDCNYSKASETRARARIASREDTATRGAFPPWRHFVRAGMFRSLY